MRPVLLLLLANLLLPTLAALALGRLGPHAKAALPALIAAVGDRGHLHNGGITSYADHPSSVCEAAIAAIARIDPKALKGVARAALPGLLDRLKGDDTGE